jgi:polar amino acid transport system permease protein
MSTLTTRQDREAARRARHRRAMLISSVSTVIVIGGLAAIVLTSPGWPSVRSTFFSWSAFTNSIGHVAAGFWLDVRMFLVVEVVVLVVGLVIALIRVVDLPALFPLKLLAVVYVDVMRGVESVHPSQGAAALALGLTRWQALRYVIIPQAVRRVVPPLLNDFISLQKDVALVSIIGPQEAFRVAQIFSDQNFNYTPLIAAALLYLCVTIPLTRLVDHLQLCSLRERGAMLALGPH